MFDHISLRTHQFDVMTAFYEHALAPLGIKMLMAFEGGQGLGAMRRCCRLTAPSEPSSSIDLALSTPDKSAIRAFHPAALRAGGKTMTPRARATSPRAITPPSSSIPTATTSKRSDAAPEPDAPAGRCGVAQGQASAISVFAPSSAASSIGAKPCGRSGGVEAMVTRP
jgi:hypothetical protein